MSSKVHFVASKLRRTSPSEYWPKSPSRIQALKQYALRGGAFSRSRSYAGPPSLRLRRRWSSAAFTTAPCSASAPRAKLPSSSSCWPCASQETNCNWPRPESTRSTQRLLPIGQEVKRSNFHENKSQKRNCHPPARTPCRAASPGHATPSRRRKTLGHGKGNRRSQNGRPYASLGKQVSFCRRPRRAESRQADHQPEGNL